MSISDQLKEQAAINKAIGAPVAPFVNRPKVEPEKAIKPKQKGKKK